MRFGPPAIIVRFFLCLAAGISSSMAGPSAAPPDKAGPVIPLKAQPFDLTDVQLLDGPFRDAMLRDKTVLLSLDADRLLHNFRVTAGLPSQAVPLGGWEAPGCQLRGHFVGHYLSACALMYASTGDEALKKRADYIVAELAKCQEAMPAMGYNKGFLSAYPESLFDMLDAGKKVWAPYYTLQKIMAGLLDVYEHCGNRQALEVDEHIADWLEFRVGRLSYDQMQRALATEQGGMNEVLSNLYAVTGKSDYLKLAASFNHEAVFAPLAAGEDKLDRLHANTQIPKIIGAARQYELTGDQRMHNIASFFWDRVALNRSWVIGGDSDREHFFAVTDFARHLSGATAETCNTYNMLKLTRHLFEWEPSATQMDFYERALYNHILASQDPDTGMMTYFVSMKPGHFKVYSTPLDSFWCCMGTGIENHAKYGDTIYFHAPDTLYVNLFIASTLRWGDEGVTVRQETQFPNEEGTTLTIHCAQPRKFAIELRHPAWAAQVAVSINGKAQPATGTPASYLTLDRMWHDGDKIEYRLPMTLRVEPLPDSPSTVSLLYGPLVLAGDMGSDGLPGNGQEARDQLDLDKVPDPPAPLIACPTNEILSHIRRAPGGGIAFRTDGLVKPADLPLVPLYRLHHERYTVYWATGAPAAAASSGDGIALSLSDL
jgi:DUF1680 family protein